MSDQVLGIMKTMKYSDECSPDRPLGGDVMKMLCLTAIKGDKYQPGKYHEHEKREGPATIFTQ